MVVNCKSNDHKVSRTLESIFKILRCTKQSSGVRGSPGGSSYENLESELVKSFHPNRREVRVPEYRSRNKRSQYHPMATWARKAHNHVSKSLAMSRLDFGQGVWKGDSYRQLALIPVCDAPDSIIH